MDAPTLVHSKVIKMAGHNKVNIFLIDNVYYFKYYFKEGVVFDKMKEYYNNHQYRFELPEDEIDDVREFLAEYGYWLVKRTDFDEFIVLVEMYTDHPEGIVKNSVVQTTVDNYNCFLLTNKHRVEQAIERGAIRLTKTKFSNPF